jgi:hypothetical protein
MVLNMNRKALNYFIILTLLANINIYCQNDSINVISGTHKNLYLAKKNSIGIAVFPIHNIDVLYLYKVSNTLRTKIGFVKNNNYEGIDKLIISNQYNRNDSVRTKPEKISSDGKTDKLIIGLEQVVYSIDKALFFTGVSYVRGKSKNQIDFVGTIDTISYSTKKHTSTPFHISRSNEYIVTGLQYHLGFEYLFTHWLSITIRPSISIYYFDLIKSNLSYNGKLYIPVNKSFSHSSMNIDNVWFYINIQF